MKGAYTLTRGFLIIAALLSVVLFSTCKKDKDDTDKGGNVGIQVLLPAGSQVDLSKTSVYAISKTFGVGADGKATIIHNGGAWEIAYLIDNATNKIMLAGFISDESKEISVTTTAQVMLYYGMGTFYSATSDKKIAAIKKIPTYAQFAGFKTHLDSLFAADPLMLSKDAYMSQYMTTLNAVGFVPVIDIFGKQIKVENADELKSGMKVNPQAGSDENIEVWNMHPRRGHAYMYKMSYLGTDNASHLILPQITPSINADDNLAVLGLATSGPKALPLQSHEKESTWKVRVIGVGGNESDIEPTNVEAAKLEQMWLEFFAVDMLMPVVLDYMNHQSALQYSILPNDIEKVRPFINEVKAVIQPGTLELVKESEYSNALRQFSKYALWDGQKRDAFCNALLGPIKDLSGSVQFFHATSELEEYVEYQHQVLTFTEKVIYGTKENENSVNLAIDKRFQTIADCSTMEEWTVKSSDNDVKITPKHSQVQYLTNHTLTVNATASLANGESLEYVWETAGVYGKLKATSSGTKDYIQTTTTNTVLYYGETVPAEDNIEEVTVTVYIKGPGGRREIGKDKATINVKKLKILMKPENVTLAPVHNIKSLKLYLVNADGTNPIVNGSAVQTKVEWSTGGSYGHFEGEVTSYTNNKNFIVYHATDTNVKTATENITARVYFKLQSTGWILKQEVKGSVRIENDVKKVIYFTAPKAYTTREGNYRASGCAVKVEKMDSAISYSVFVDGIDSKLYPTYSDSWTVTGTEAHVRGYLSYVWNDPEDVALAGEDYYTGIYGTFSWGSCNGCTPHIPNCTGTARVTVLVKQ